MSSIIGEMCRNARLAKGISLEEMAILTGITKQGLSRFETGKCRTTLITPLIYEAVTDIELITAIASALRRKLDDYYDVKNMSGMMVMAMKGVNGIKGMK